MRRIVWCFWASLLLSSLIACAFKSSVNAETVAHVKFIPQLVESHSTSRRFTVACVIENVTDLCGVEIMFSWDTNWLYYDSHTLTMPIEDYPSPQAPSPYPGILHAPIAVVQDRVEIVAGTYESVATFLGGSGFNGSGTVFAMTFQVWDDPWPEDYIDTILHFEQINLRDSDAQPITHTEQDGIVRIHETPWTGGPSEPMLKVMPETIGGVQANETFPVDVWLMGGDDTPLDSFWDVSGVDFYLHFNATLIEATNVIIDPYDWFSEIFFSGPIVEIAKEINNTAGTVRVAFNASDGTHFAPFGLITIVTVEFKALLEVSEWSPPSCVIGLRNPSPRPVVCGVETPVFLEGYQHPDRGMCPWNNSDSRVSLPNSVENATYFTRFEQGVLVTIHSPVMKNHSMETLWLNVTANVPVETWWYSLNSGSNVSFTPNSTITVGQCENSLVVYAGSLGMEGSASVQFYALTGDLDGDRDVDIFDIVLLAKVYSIIQGHPDYKPEYDIYPPPSGDGVLDIFDIVTMAGNYGTGC